jgi:hypothetical protein
LGAVDVRRLEFTPRPLAVKVQPRQGLAILHVEVLVLRNVAIQGGGERIPGWEASDRMSVKAVVDGHIPEVLLGMLRHWVVGTGEPEGEPIFERVGGGLADDPG